MFVCAAVLIDAIDTVLSEYIRRQLAIPKPARRKGRGVRYIELRQLTQALRAT